MPRCTACHRPYEPPAAGLEEICPDCGHKEPVGDGPVGDRSEHTHTWAPIARMTNLAEAGYFHDVLAAEDYACRVVEQNEFDAVSHVWQPTFVLLVAAVDRQRAIALLEEELERTGGSALLRTFSPAPLAAPDATTEQSAPSRSWWGPLILAAALCGIAALCVLQPWRRQAAGALAGESSLWKALSALKQPLQSTAAAGQAGVALRFDRRQGAVVLEEDLNGDGRWDRRREFRDGILTAERRR